MTGKYDEFDPHLLKLISDLQDGCLREDDRVTLNNWLKRDPDARQYYHAMMNLHLQLDQAYSEDLNALPMPELLVLADQDLTQDELIRSRRRSFGWMGIAAALMVGLFLNAWALRNRKPDAEAITTLETEHDPVNGVAVLAHAIGIRWDEAAPHNYREGDALPRGMLRLAQGYAQIEFFSGAIVILEGPSEFELLSSDRARLAVGKLRAYVPEPARGFTIEGPDFDTVDLGTEFAMSLDQDGYGEIHVIDGEVSLRNKNGHTIQDLSSGQAVRTTKQAGSFEKVEISTTTFVGRKQIAKMVRKDFRVTSESWREQRDRWAGDPDTVVYFDFENQKRWDRQLKSAKPGAPEGAIVGAQWTQGRWPGKGAIRFNSDNDRIRLNVPGEYDSVSFAIHVRLDGLSQPLNSLFMADETNPSGPYWQIRKTGALKFRTRQIGSFDSDPILTPQDIGRWLHLAVVYDRQRKSISHYLDGMLVWSGEMKTDQPFRTGDAELGNWQTEGKPLKNRRLTGTVDEFLIVGRALSKIEISQLARSADLKTEPPSN